MLQSNHLNIETSSNGETEKQKHVKIQKTNSTTGQSQNRENICKSHI